MKALLISDLPRSTDDLRPLFSEYEFELIHYRSPLKALDNVEEIGPNVVIINARDFPRHWKPITQHIRWDTSKEEILVVLLTPPDFSADEADKAMFLGVQGVITIKESGNYEKIIEELRMIFDRYNYAHAKNISKTVQFLFTNPVNETIITGTVKNLTEKGLVFLPDMPANTGNLTAGTVLDQCSLKIENGFIVPNCSVASNETVLNLNFIDLSDEDKKTITDFLN
ncbi:MULTISPECIES: hypothetical protein [unclassified Treponema]|uniref:hypothetical protein n=1 Tax=unclassified Treponema TaxID=2638727 RepID=UPI0020A3454F|nr:MULTISPECIES: hypothetical protein [unclassified Treponema]UTC65946.1 hypothetical protein E4O06_07870 [Treponema sp. OMZ 789]UTC68674.1 hypothetical protein E4O01_08010 [Treponema sp. OMZ 790]UTC71404.1 hypothetical protein E4O02_08205 [Treponema sp. OMZ 791]